ncbi:hypothetical protein HYU06_00890 [Candidatus Woesearchaeota archaeon]|nr:hypothetical protein [Candidatus Woesearchaeota archaeon]
MTDITEDGTVIVEELLEAKVNDYHACSAAMPENIGILGKLFAYSLGNATGRMLAVYRKMFDEFGAGKGIEDVKGKVHGFANSVSKINLQLPFSSQTQARICGLVALNYSGFWDTVVELYSSLIQDINPDRSVSIAELVEEIKVAARQHPLKYSDLLKNKRQAISDFGVLMGFTEDETRLAHLKSEMNEKIALYFDRVRAKHKGGRLGIGWPLPLRKFSAGIMNAIYYDTAASAIQNGLGENYGFLPVNNTGPIPLGAYCSAEHDPEKSSSFAYRDIKQLFLIRAIPTALIYLSAIQPAYAHAKEEILGPNDESSLLGLSCLMSLGTICEGMKR